MVQIYIYIDAGQITSSSGVYKTNKYDKGCICGYLERGNDKIFKFRENNSLCLSLSPSLSLPLSLSLSLSLMISLSLLSATL